MKKILLLIIMVLALGMLAGCGDSPGNASDNNNIEYTGDVERVGNAEFGFIYLPVDWNNFMDVGMTHAGIPHVGFMSLEGSIVNLISYGVIPGLDLVPFIASLDVEYQIVSLDGNDAFRTKAAVNEGEFYLFGWYFTDENDNFRLITAEGPIEELNVVVNLIERTFSLSE